MSERTEAEIETTPEGQVPKGAGWYLLNLREARWKESERLGAWCTFEGDQQFPHLGINVHVIQPGQASCMYHREELQEGFLILAGECTLIVEEEERQLGAWDYFHCPPGTAHVFVGAGERPCAILAVGGRVGDKSIEYPVSELAQRFDAGVQAATDSPAEAYAGLTPPRPIPAPWPPR